MINEQTKVLLKAGKKVYKLGFGQSPFPVPGEVVEALIVHAAVKDYLPVKGLYELRVAVADHLKRVQNLNYTADNILIGPGSKELIYSSPRPVGFPTNPKPICWDEKPSGWILNPRTTGAWIPKHSIGPFNRK